MPVYLHLTAHHARATGNIYYVDQDEGNDTWDGLYPTYQGGQNGPWQSITHANDGPCSLLPCYAAYPTGSTIKFEDGETWTDSSGTNSYLLDPCYNSTQNEACSGSSIPTGDGQLTLTNYCDVDCTTEPIFNGNGDNATIQLHNQQWWDISNLTITNYPSSCTKIEPPPIDQSCWNSTVSRRGIYVYANGSNAAVYQHIYVSNVTVKDVLGYSHGIQDMNAAKLTGGIVYYIDGSGSPATFDDIHVTGTTMHDVYFEGIILTSDWKGPPVPGQPCFSDWTNYQPSTRELVDSNKVWYMGGDGIVVHVSSGVSLGTVISNNLVHDGGWAGALNEGIASLDNLNAVIEHNQVYNMLFYGSDQGVYADSVPFDVDDCDNGTKVEYNYSHDNQGGFMTIEPYAINATVRYNISERDGYGDLNQEQSGYGIGAILKVPQNGKPLGDAGQNWMVYNNTFYMDDQHANGPGTQLLDVALPSGLSPAPLFENNLIENKQNGLNDTYASCSGANFQPQLPAPGTPWTVDYNDFYSTIRGGCPDTPTQLHDIISNGDPGFAIPGAGFDGQPPPTGDNNSDWRDDAAAAYALTLNANVYCTGLILEVPGDDNVDFNNVPLPKANHVDPGALEHSLSCSP